MVLIILGLMLMSFQAGNIYALIPVIKKVGGNITVNPLWLMVGPILIILGLVLG